jgi:hypothetical protein
MLETRDPGCKVKLFGMVTFLFVCGMAAGAFGWHVTHTRWFCKPATALSAEDKAAALEQFHRELELTEQQAQAVESILDQFIMEQAELMARFRTSRISGQERLNQVLTEDQRRRLKKMLGEGNTQQH